MIKSLAILLCLLIAVPANAGLIFGPDAFTVAGDTNIDAYPGGGADYTYSIGATTDLLVNATSDWVIPRDNGSVTAFADVTDGAISASMGDQEARAVVSGTAAAVAGSVSGVGCKDDGSGDHYIGVLDATANETTIYEAVGAGYAVLSSADRGLAGATDYTLAFRCTSSAQRLIINGDTAVTASDATRSTGRPGVFGLDQAAAGTAGKIDDFEVDDLSTGIWLVGVGAQTAGSTSGANVACAWPSGYSATTNDFGILFVVGKVAGNTNDIAAPSGWPARGEQFLEIGATDLKIQTFSRVIQSGDSAPNVVVHADWSGTSLGIACQMGVWRGVDTSTSFDQADVGSTSTAAATFTPTGVTTTTANSHVIGFVGTFDDNGLRMSTPRNFTAWMGGLTYDVSASVGDFSVGMGSRQVVSASTAVTMPTWTQSVNGTDQWVALAMGLRPSSGAPAVVRNLLTMGVGM